MNIFLACLAALAISLLMLLFSGCAQVTTHIYADNGANVYCSGKVDKETAVEALRGAKGEVGLMP